MQFLLMIFITVASKKMEFVNSSVDEAALSQIKLSLEKLEELEAIHDWYFTESKLEKQNMIDTMIAQILETIATIPDEEREKNRSLISFIKGKSLNCYDGYKQESEELLSASVKLDPQNFKAWTALGQCLWKKGDRVQARNCFLESISQTVNKEALLDLSVLMRQLRIKGQDPSASVEESIRLAKQAISLDVTDHKSWYILGNAWCTRFFSTSYNRIDLNKALNCYKRSESFGGEGNPDLYMNSGNVYRYLQNYVLAIRSYQKAHEIDPLMSEPVSAIEEIQSLLSKTRDLISNNLKIRKTRFDQLVHQLQSSRLAENSVDISTLNAGNNYNTVLVLKPLLPVSKGKMPPKSFISIDKFGQFFLLSIYDFAENAAQFEQDDVIAVHQPYLRNNTTKPVAVTADTSSKGTSEASGDDSLKLNIKLNSASPLEVQDDFIIIQVFDIRTIRVNGKSLNMNSIAAPELMIETFDT